MTAAADVSAVPVENDAGKLEWARHVHQDGGGAHDILMNTIIREKCGKRLAIQANKQQVRQKEHEKASKLRLPAISSGAVTAATRRNASA